MTKQAIIVLREELEYFSIPPKVMQSKGISEQAPAAKRENGTTPSPLEIPANTVTTPALLDLKQQCGNALLERKQIFTALQRNVNKENNMAEQHLIDMLCMRCVKVDDDWRPTMTLLLTTLLCAPDSGFDRDDTWGFRAVEPNRCCITSIALVLLKTGITSKGGDASDSLGGDEAAGKDVSATTGALADDFDIDQQQLSTAQKLLLFWRKPARKCWWDGVDVVLPLQEDEASAAADAAAGQDESAASGGGMTPAEIQLLKDGRGRRTRVWARRVWTLELSLVSAGWLLPVTLWARH